MLVTTKGARHVSRSSPAEHLRKSNSLGAEMLVVNMGVAEAVVEVAPGVMVMVAEMVEVVGMLGALRVVGVVETEETWEAREAVGHAAEASLAA